MYLPEAFKGINPSLISKRSGLLDFIVSELNESGMLQNQIDTSNGHYRTVELVYQPRRDEDDVASGSVQSCTGGTTYGETSELINITPSTEGATHTWTADLTDLEQRCQSDEMYWARQMAAAMSVMRRKISTDSATQVDALVGSFEDGTTDKTIATKSGNAWLTDPIEEITYEYDLMQAPGTPFVFGVGDISKYFKATEAGCCAQFNVDLGEYAAQNPIVFMEDDSVRKAVTTSKFLSTIPGAIQMIRYNEFRGETREIDQPTYKQYTVIDPVNGLEYDFWAKFDCGNWFFGLKLAYKFVGLPDDIFFTDDELSGVNYINKWTVSNL